MSLTWIIEGKLAAAPIPRSIADLEDWWHHGIRAVVNLLEEHEKILKDEDYIKIGFDYYPHPIPDMDAPDLADLKRIVKWIDDKINEGKPVLVHCYAGLGRTGTVIAAYIIYKERIHVDEAVKFVRTKRPGSVQSFEQFITLETFQRYLDSI